MERESAAPRSESHRHVPAASVHRHWARRRPPERQRDADRGSRLGDGPTCEGGPSTVAARGVKMAQRAEPTQGERTAHQVEIAEKSQRLSRWRRPKERWRLREWGSCFSKPGLDSHGIRCGTRDNGRCHVSARHCASWEDPVGNGKPITQSSRYTKQSKRVL